LGKYLAEAKRLYGGGSEQQPVRRSPGLLGEKGESPSLRSQQHGTKDHHWLLSVPKGSFSQPAFSASLGRKGSLLEQGEKEEKGSFSRSKRKERKVSLRLQRKGIWP
jgi:hypothetical protein